MDGLLQDLRYAVRTLTRAPGFTLVAVLTLALGIGASTAIFSVADGVLWRALPYREPGSLAVVWGTAVDGRFGTSELERLRYRDAHDVFARVGAYEVGAANLTGGGEAEWVGTVAMDADLLPTLGVQPLVGRNFAADEDRPGGPRAALIGYGLWQRRFAGRRSAIGSGIDVDGVRVTVVGVLPPAFRVPTDQLASGSDVYLPLALADSPEPDNIHYLTAVARLAPGLDVAGAESRLAVLSSTLRAELATLPPTFRARAVPVRDEIVGRARPILLCVLGAVALLLLIACVNVANLLLVRAGARRRELAVRAALGAAGGRLVQQLLTESALLAAGGGGVGLLLAVWGLSVLATLRPSGLPWYSGVGLDPIVIGFAAALTALTAASCGVVPLWQLRRQGLRHEVSLAHRGTADPAARRTRFILVVAQLAFAVMLAVGAGLVSRSVWRLQAVDPGFSARDLLTMQLSLPETRYPDAASTRRFYGVLLERVRALPGVLGAGAVSWLPLTGLHGDWGIRIEGREEERLASGRRPWADWVVATDGYLDALGATLVAGRFLTRADLAAGQPVVVVNQTLANRYGPAGHALGMRFRLSTNVDSGVYRTVIGVVADIQQAGLDGEPRPTMYLPHAQFPAGGGRAAGTMSLAIRTQGDALGVTGAVRAAIRALDPDVPPSAIRTIAAVRSASASVRRFAAALFDIFGVAALLLVAVGVYGVIAYAVGLRTRELAVRMALGSTSAGVLRLLLSDGARLAAVGIGLGLMGAAALSRLLASLLFQVDAHDPATFVMSAAAVAAIAALACYVPARRATRVDPVVALRSE